VDKLFINYTESIRLYSSKASPANENSDDEEDINDEEEEEKENDEDTVMEDMIATKSKIQELENNDVIGKLERGEYVSNKHLEYLDGIKEEYASHFDEESNNSTLQGIREVKEYVEEELDSYSDKTPISSEDSDDSDDSDDSSETIVPGRNYNVSNSNNDNSSNNEERSDSPTLPFDFSDDPFF
jgi:hypothetical protein